MASILLVDDDDGIVEVYTEHLTRAGHVVTPASNGEGGMILAEYERFDVVITDLIMPQKEGLQFIIELRQRDPEMKIIAISGGGGRVGPGDWLAMARQFGASKILAKPFSGAELVEAVRRLLEEAPR